MLRPPASTLQPQSHAQALRTLAGQGAGLGVLASLIALSLGGWVPSNGAVWVDRAGILLVVLAGLITWGAYQSAEVDAATGAGLGHGGRGAGLPWPLILRLGMAGATCFVLEAALRLV